MTALVPTSASSVTVFGKSHRLSVRQRKRWLEIITSLDARNVYLVYDEAGQPVFNVEEQGSGFGAFMKRLLLAGMRPFTSRVEDLSSGGSHLLTLRRPFRFIFHRLEVTDANGTSVGAIQRKWTWFRRKYIVEGADGQPVATLFGPFFRPWTFKVLVDGDNELGLIQKKWSGLLKEAFSDADNFWVQFEAIEDPNLRALLFSATVLIDVVHFERSN